MAGKLCHSSDCRALFSYTFSRDLRHFSCCKDGLTFLHSVGQTWFVWWAPVVAPTFLTHSFGQLCRGRGGATGRRGRAGGSGGRSQAAAVNLSGAEGKVAAPSGRARTGRGRGSGRGRKGTQHMVSLLSQQSIFQVWM